MRLPQAAPGEAGGPDFEHFTYWSIAGGQKHHAYLAGPCQWFVVHPSERTKPCLHWMTKGEVPCTRCGGKKPKQLCGYLPVWRASDWRPKLVVVYEAEREWLEPLKLHARVLIGRENEKGAQLYVRATLDQNPPFNTTNERRKYPQDVWRSLLLAWELPELTNWFQCRRPVSDNVLSLNLDVTAEKAKTEDPPEEKTENEPPVGVNRLKAGGAVDDAVQRLMRRAKETSAETNGKHKPE